MVISFSESRMRAAMRQDASYDLMQCLDVLRKNSRNKLDLELLSIPILYRVVGYNTKGSVQKSK